MRRAVTLLTLLIFLAGSAKAQPTVGTTYTAGSGADQTSYTFADFTVTSPTAKSILHLTIIARGSGETASADANATTCSVGGVTAAEVNQGGAATRTKQAHILRANFPGSGAAGDYAVVCSTTGSALDGVLVSITQVDGLAQQAPEATVDVAVSTGTSTSNNITTVTANAFVVDSMHLSSTADPGTFTPGTDQTTLAGFYQDTGINRALWSSYKIGPITPGSTAMAVSWVNSATAGGRVNISAYEVEEAVEDVKPPVITVIQPFPNPGAPPPSLTITNDSPLSEATEAEAYSAVFLATGGTDPKTVRVNPNSGDLNGWTASSGSPAWSEKWSEPAPCDFDNVWGSSTGLTVVETSPLGTRCVGAKAAGTSATAQTGLASNRLSVKVRDFHRTGSSANTIVAFTDSGTALLGFVEVKATGSVEVRATGDTSRVVGTVGADSTFDIELDCTLDGTISCRSRIGSGDWVTSHGTSTAQIDGWRLGHGPDGSNIQYYGQIDTCLLGPVDTACASTDLWTRTGTPRPNNVYFNGFELATSNWSWNAATGGTLSVEWPTNPDDDLVETGNLPTGLSMTSAGVLSGTPAVGTAAGSPHLFTIRAIDPNLLTGSKEFSLPINAEPPPPDPPTDPEPWITGFTPVRQHYVTPTGSGSQDGTIGNPESMATAMTHSHYACGDLHHFRGGTYDFPTIFGGDGNKFLTRDCTSTSQVVWKGYVDPATGQPEDAHFARATFALQGDWHWFVGIRQTDTRGGSTPNTNNVRAAGVRFINGVIHDTSNTSLGMWNEGPGQVVYGMTTYRPGCSDSPNLHHNVYTQNNFSLYGKKYFIQSMFLETTRNAAEPCGNYIWHGYAVEAQADRPISGYHLQDNLFGDAPNSGSVLFSHDAGTPSTDNTIFRNYFVNFYHTTGSDWGLRLGRKTPFVGTITHNYFARTAVTPEGYWGAVDSHDPFVFTDNEIYDPSGSDHIAIFETRASEGAVGSHKIQNSDVWNNNTYGGTFRARGPFCNGTSFTSSTLAEWRTRTNACRATPGSAGFDLDSTVVANPTTNKIAVLKNEYQCPTCVFNDQARGNIYIVNWSGTTSNITVNISSVVGVSKSYTVRYARDFFGTAAASGTCPGSGACNVALPPRRSSGEAAGKFLLTYVITGAP